MLGISICALHVGKEEMRMTRLVINRGISTKGGTPGEIGIGDSGGKMSRRLAWTLEDPSNPLHVRAGEKGAIPPGLYELALTWSNRFERPLPLIMDVPGFIGIRIHAGNTEADTKGCVLVGMQVPLMQLDGKLFLRNSKTAEKEITARVKSWVRMGKVWVLVHGNGTEDMTEAI
jgi:hypothetical protein